ncbi:MAG: hypothetical protein J6U62_05160 [Bacteroidaceae bacterium]|nr:hypothetical protein [Bacteroidaceae bacterium]
MSTEEKKETTGITDVKEVKKNKKKKKRGGIINTIIGGRLFTNELVRRNIPLIALVVFFSFIYVSNRYEYERELKQIEFLTKKRDALKNNLLTLKSEFASKSRQTALESILKSRDSELESAKEPIFIIRK